MPRIVAGLCKGIPLLAPEGLETRPTADRVKEALFSILQTRILDASFLDLFSGSGQIGLEAVSRGAKKAVLIESSEKSQEIIRKNIEKTKLSQNVLLLGSDVFRGLKELGKKKEVFDIIYMDPPYDDVRRHLEKAARIIKENGLLKPDGILIAEHRAEDTLDQNVINLTLYRSCKYGTTMITFYTTE